MSETQYFLEYAKTGRAKCKAGKACENPAIQKDELRFGTVFDMNGHNSVAWRHWECVTDKILEKITEPEDIGGFSDLREEDQARIAEGVRNGHIAGGIDEKKEAAKKAKAAADAEAANGDEEPIKKPAKRKAPAAPKKAPAKKTKKAAAAESDEEEHASGSASASDAEEEEKPKKKRAKSAPAPAESTRTLRTRKAKST
ncbi:hypothetical protein H9P43_003070 [Blastocladiella emersonii ATCC 22665]|nr:hypothetical protein H9P43_003070 [Blastocladiella emersonii ATCC 22665]